VGILPLDFHFSMRSQGRGCGNVEIAPAISKGLWAAVENLLLVFHRCPQPVISAAF
jgi:hypothetical protein